eukprot:CAMPEP_0198568530 /NCGR_PEP_ID=MMETSP1462-20131121/106567_1 /TAXON_ID=1333877 /ORGANISM="Brandtodinium nutriculum, Strain RCC3387" /LENGTH=49 /DNA_ID= /DNA_START= /DNA_END= /DNA_ORIENTATION=
MARHARKRPRLPPEKTPHASTASAATKVTKHACSTQVQTHEKPQPPAID